MEGNEKTGGVPGSYIGPNRHATGCEKVSSQERRCENNPRRPCLPSIGAARRKTNRFVSVALASRSLSEQADIPHQAVEHFTDVGDEHCSNQR